MLERTNGNTFSGTILCLQLEFFFSFVSPQGLIVSNSQFFTPTASKKGYFIIVFQFVMVKCLSMGISFAMPLVFTTKERFHDLMNNESKYRSER